MTAFKYKDFLPAETERGGLFGGVEFSHFDSCVTSMNVWLQENPVAVHRVETVTLPNIYSMAEEGSNDTELHASAHTLWYQFVRLWYQE